MKRARLASLGLLALAGCAATPSGRASSDGELARVVADAERLDGLLALHHDAAAGRLVLRLPPPDERGVALECLWASGLSGGLGSNPVGLDRGFGGATRLVRFRRVGARVVVEQPALAFRAEGAPAAEALAVEQSFARSILWAGAFEEQPDGALLVDLEGLLVADRDGLAEVLREAGQGSFRLDAARSMIAPEGPLVFPDNVELDVLLTFEGEAPGAEVRATAPDPRAVTLVAHHSFVRLPDAGYEPRELDPRAGAIGMRFADYAAALDAPLERRLAVRHRVGPGRPIVYHVDPGAPEPVRSALLEGARWWSAAFDAAGLEGLFRVELLPEGAHPLDVRYDVIQWVHRATRGWSYGGGVTDPRTGEQLKGHVRLGSLRVRQDRLLFEGLAGVAQTGAGAPDDPVELALARIRQLAAHEVGHALGLAHNFAASAAGRASVMDYPAPLVRVDAAGELDFGSVYDVGVGAWDLVAIRWLYGAGSRAERAALLDEARAQGLVFLSDDDARPAGGAHPRAHLWDNFATPLEDLANALAVRRVALARFGADRLAAGRPMGELGAVLAPVYLHHRYALEAASKLVGGLEYEHSLRGDGREGLAPVAPQVQRAAIAALLRALEPAELDLPERVLALLAPPAPGAEPSREDFAARSAPAFDAVGAAATAAELAVGALLQRERCARLVDQHRRDAALPGLEELLELLITALFQEPAGEPARLAALRRAEELVLVERMVALAADPAAAPAVRATLEARLEALLAGALAAAAGEPAERAHLRARVRRFLERAEDAPPAPAPADPPPPGSPIGACSQG